jgi:hypothetical protein
MGMTHQKLVEILGYAMVSTVGAAVSTHRTALHSALPCSSVANTCGSATPLPLVPVTVAAGSEIPTAISSSSSCQQALLLQYAYTCPVASHSL